MSSLIHSAKVKSNKALTRTSTIEDGMSAEYKEYEGKLTRLSKSLGLLESHLSGVDGKWSELVKSQRAFADDFFQGYPQTDPLSDAASRAVDSTNATFRDISSPKDQSHPTKSEAAKVTAFKAEVEALLQRGPALKEKFAETQRYDKKTDDLVAKVAKAGSDKKKAAAEAKVTSNQSKRDSAREEYNTASATLVSDMKACWAKNPLILRSAHSAYWHIQTGASDVVHQNAQLISTTAKGVPVEDIELSASKLAPVTGPDEGSTSPRDTPAGVVAVGEEAESKDESATEKGVMSSGKAKLAAAGAATVAGAAAVGAAAKDILPSKTETPEAPEAKVDDATTGEAVSKEISSAAAAGSTAAAAVKEDGQTDVEKMATAESDKAKKAAEKAKKEEEKAAEKAKKEAEKAEKAAEKAKKEEEKAAEKAKKEEEKAAEKAKKEEEKAAEKAKKEAEKAKKEEEKAAEKAKKDAEKAKKEGDKAGEMTYEEDNATEKVKEDVEAKDGKVTGEAGEEVPEASEIVADKSVPALATAAGAAGVAAATVSASDDKAADPKEAAVTAEERYVDATSDSVENSGLDKEQAVPEGQKAASPEASATPAIDVTEPAMPEAADSALEKAMEAPAPVTPDNTTAGMEVKEVSPTVEEPAVMKAEDIKSVDGPAEKTADQIEEEKAIEEKLEEKTGDGLKGKAVAAVAAAAAVPVAVGAAAKAKTGKSSPETPAAEQKQSLLRRLSRRVSKGKGDCECKKDSSGGASSSKGSSGKSAGKLSGVGISVKDAASKTASKASDAAASAKDGASDSVAAAGDKVFSVAGSAAEKTSGVTEKLTETAKAGSSVAKDAAEKTSDGVSAVVDKTKEGGSAVAEKSAEALPSAPKAVPEEKDVAVKGPYTEMVDRDVPAPVTAEKSAEGTDDDPKAAIAQMEEPEVRSSDVPKVDLPEAVEKDAPKKVVEESEKPETAIGKVTSTVEGGAKKAVGKTAEGAEKAKDTASKLPTKLKTFLNKRKSKSGREVVSE